MKSSFLILMTGVILIAAGGPPNCGAQTTMPDRYAVASAQTLGEVHGTTRDASKALLPHVQVKLHSFGTKSDRVVVSDSAGVFVAPNLIPGRYELSASKASKEGFASSPPATVDVARGQKLQMSLLLGPPSPVAAGLGDGPIQPSADLPARPAEAPVNRSAPAADPAVPPAVWAEIDALKKRVEQLEAELHQRNGQGASAATVAAAPAADAAAASNHGSAPAAEQPPALATTAMNLAPSASAAAATAAPASPAAQPGTPSPASPALITPAQSPDKQAKPDPFSDADWSWLNGNPRTKDIYWGTKFFTPEVRADTNYNWQNQHPADHSLGGSSETFREGEVQLEQLGVGGDFHWDNVRARLMTQFGMYSETTPRNDASPANGEWNLDTAYRYISEAYGGYHFNVLDGINVDAGIFMSYIGLFSYYNFDNWAYQPSYVSSNTPWFFNGVRIQIFPTEHLKIEPWFINGWQSYASANNRPGIGGQIKWTPFNRVNIISNNYGLGHDDLYAPGRARIHTDDSIEVKYYDRPDVKGLDKMAFTFTGDLGCEYGGGVSCTGDHTGGPKQSFVGAMLYNRWWFYKDQFAVTLGGGAINNPGRYLVLLPPINGETATSADLNSPYFTENPGDKFKAWDTSITFDWMPKQYITFRMEGDYRHADVPYWSGRGGITPPAYANTPADFINGNGYPTEYACNNGAPSGATALAVAQAACSSLGGVWFPSLVKSEFLMDFDILVKF
jgi:hypothetical protein